MREKKKNNNREDQWKIIAILYNKQFSYADGYIWHGTLLQSRRKISSTVDLSKRVLLSE